MYRLTWSTSYGADGKALGRLLWCAVVAFGPPFLDDLYLAIEASRAAFDERNVCQKTHPVDMTPSIEVIERIEYDVEILKPGEAKLRIFYVRMMRLELHFRIESCSRLFSDLVM